MKKSILKSFFLSLIVVASIQPVFALAIDENQTPVAPENPEQAVETPYHGTTQYAVRQLVCEGLPAAALMCVFGPAGGDVFYNGFTPRASYEYLMWRALFWGNIGRKELLFVTTLPVTAKVAKAAYSTLKRTTTAAAKAVYSTLKQELSEVPSTESVQSN